MMVNLSRLMFLALALGCANMTIVVDGGATGGVDGGDRSSSGPGDLSATGVISTTSGGDSSGSSDGGTDSSGGSSGIVLECFPQTEPYTECDQSCGDEACGPGLRCIGDAFGYAMCVSWCESSEECPPIGWAAPNDDVICQASPDAFYPGGIPVGDGQSWCWPPCVKFDICPVIDGQLLTCSPLGNLPVCVWPPPE